MDKPKWWELGKKKIEEAQAEADDFETETQEDDFEEIIEYGSAEDLNFDNSVKNTSNVMQEHKESATEEEVVDDFDFDVPESTTEQVDETQNEEEIETQENDTADDHILDDDINFNISENFTNDSKKDISDKQKENEDAKWEEIDELDDFNLETPPTKKDSKEDELEEVGSLDIDDDLDFDFDESSDDHMGDNSSDDDLDFNIPDVTSKQNTHQQVGNEEMKGIDDDFNFDFNIPATMEEFKEVTPKEAKDGANNSQVEEIVSTGSIEDDVKAMNVDMTGVSLASITESGDWKSGLEEDDDEDIKNEDKVVIQGDAIEEIDELDDFNLEAPPTKKDSKEDELEEVGGLDIDDDLDFDFDTQDEDANDVKEDKNENENIKVDGLDDITERTAEFEDGDDDIGVSDDDILEDNSNTEDKEIHEFNDDLSSSHEPATEDNVSKKPDKHEKPTGREIAKMLSNTMESEEESVDEENHGFKNHTVHLHDYIIHHKSKVAIALCGLVFFILAIYLMYVGVETKSIPTFTNERIVVKKVESVNVRYGFGKELTFHNAQMEFILDGKTTIELVGDFTISASIFAMMSNSITHAHMNIKGATINVKQNKDGSSVQDIILQMVDGGYDAFADIKFFNTRINIFSEKNIKTDTFMLQDVTIQRIPEMVTVEGIIKVGLDRMNISYAYKIDTNLDIKDGEKNFSLSVKSHIFELVVVGQKRSYGTINKESRIEGKMEFVIRNPSQFASILTKVNTVSKYMLNLPQFSVEGNFEYSSLGNVLRIKDGKVNMLNSIGDFELMTVDANRRYKAVMSFDSIDAGVVAEYLKSLKFLFEKETTSYKSQYSNDDELDAVRLFSVIGATKIIDVELNAKQITLKDAVLFKDMQSVIVVSQNELALDIFKMQSGDSLKVNAKGKFLNLGEKTPYGAFSVEVSGVEDGKGVAKYILNFFTKMNLKKDIQGKNVEASFGVVFKRPSIIFHNIFIKVDNTLEMEGRLQFTEKFDDKFNNVYEFRDVSFYDADLSFLDLTLLKFKQGETTFQKMVGMRRANVEYSYSMHNAKFEENILDYGKLEMNADNGLLSVNINAEAEKYGASVSVVADVSNQNPIFKSHIVLQNITDFTMLHKNIIEFFDKKYIFFSTLDKFHGHVNITLRNSVVFGETVPYVFLRGKMQNGVTEFGEQKFASGGEFAGKISGKIDMTKHTPLFTISSSFVNLKTEEFQKILPIDTKFTGTISGGGGFVFVGLSYTEFLNSLQMKAKFVLQKIKLPQLNLNFLAQHLLKTHGNNLFTFDKQYIETNFMKDDETEANAVFSITGGLKKFTVDSCNIKTAYTAGVCAGNLAVLPNNQISFETIAKFAVPALDINKDLQDIMKLYVSSKVKYQSNEDKIKQQSEISSDLSQIYQYINYRRATFGI